MLRQAERLLALGARAVLMKGGHAARAPESADLLVTAQPRCGFAAAAHRNPQHPRHRLHARGRNRGRPRQGGDLLAAVRNAKDYITGAIAAADRLDVGRDNESRHDSGHGPIHHFYTWW